MRAAGSLAARNVGCEEQNRILLFYLLAGGSAGRLNGRLAPYP